MQDAILVQRHDERPVTVALNPSGTQWIISDEHGEVDTGPTDSLTSVTRYRYGSDNFDCLVISRPSRTGLEILCRDPEARARVAKMRVRQCVNAFAIREDLSCLNLGAVINLLVLEVAFVKQKSGDEQLSDLPG